MDVWWTFHQFSEIHVSHHAERIRLFPTKLDMVMNYWYPGFGNEIRGSADGGFVKKIYNRKPQACMSFTCFHLFSSG